MSRIGLKMVGVIAKIETTTRAFLKLLLIRSLRNMIAPVDNQKTVQIMAFHRVTQPKWATEPRGRPKMTQNYGHR
ncbi:hypothetical protein NUU61_001367 [Penicillium alfredii]|uniref:Uncharacterized protein n=1 Tax=Penicillium alfredii TaxID=1506179 RepID=A0A9W9KN93_9EURO|nr:uncharacterized protein NUU61_001367 [Penicillium alfredii]KAJ5111737.1 hypothetical protein NUU61_001367 [Penicillium alfredii]